MTSFDGITYDPEQDKERLWTALTAVRHLLGDGKWHTLQLITRQLAGDYRLAVSEAGASARFRDLRKPKFGAHVMESRRVAGGLWEYRMVVPPPAEETVEGEGHLSGYVSPPGPGARQNDLFKFPAL